jgi:hypothetical protein
MRVIGVAVLLLTQVARDDESASKMLRGGRCSILRRRGCRVYAVSGAGVALQTYRKQASVHCHHAEPLFSSEIDPAVAQIDALHHSSIRIQVGSSSCSMGKYHRWNTIVDARPPWLILHLIYIQGDRLVILPEVEEALETGSKGVVCLETAIVTHGESP